MQCDMLMTERFRMIHVMYCTFGAKSVGCLLLRYVSRATNIAYRTCLAPCHMSGILCLCIRVLLFSHSGTPNNVAAVCDVDAKEQHQVQPQCHHMDNMLCWQPHSLKHSPQIALQQWQCGHI